ncbi:MULTISPECIES: LCP family protein [unclassified Streptomyces]|uniref:LCP family protein n=2 Tax=Streptomyces TaxID=1883 RepID=UPI0001C1896D|nr:MULTISPECIES: LCP family protein [unclassified Streptomyces]MYR66542.1 LytR family transcriptional regulator [Streptomyces sp. SID4939]MYT61822.1 LytR family transcriptional regulator [Streptomyces sp. SID8357]MYT85192.1 LytR family transcriptional regulator [Streptomyces sp. SID8360]MYU36303.1 LytR family transcriptional regulator [Streptomyces sp. SID8358]MYW39113.1 LytR family transcriptional regulator [Streptomyces sp. SID1]MYX74426.1 LytR family transcriptional regulator [Streptomyces
MDAQGRGRDEGIDPADQWVLNPDTGDYELRLTPSTGLTPTPSGPSAGSPSSGPTASARSGASASRGGAAPASRRREAPGATPSSEERASVPGQRGGRRGGRGDATPERGPGGRAGGRAAPATGRRGARSTRSRKSGKKKALVWTGGALAFLLVGTATAGYLVYQHFNGNITAVSSDGAGTGGFSKDRPINVLVIGTDKRTGDGNEGYGDKESVGHADTTILFHVSKDRTNATALSVPRDLIATVPDCPTKQDDGSTKTIPGTEGDRFNTSLGQSDRTPSCTMRTITELTGLEVDHFMVADFNAVKTLTTAVDGVDVCLAKDINDKKSHLNLAKGEHTLQGEEALSFLRTRYSVGFGSDLSRIELQQQFLSSLLRKLKSNDTLTSPTKMWTLAEAATKALTVDDKIADINELRKLGMELASVDPKNITFTTVPVLDNPDDKATVILDRSKAPQVFSMMREDVSFTEVAAQKKAAAKEKEAAKLKGAKAAPADVRVDVYNGGAPAGSAQNALDWLQNSQGVLKSTNKSNAPENVKKTQLVYAPNQADQARSLAAMMGLSASALKPTTTDAGEMDPMVLTLGPDFVEAGTPLSAPEKAPDEIQRVEGDKQVCAQ